MLPFAIDSVSAEKTVEMSGVISGALNDAYPLADNATNISNAVMLAIVSVGFIQSVALVLKVDETDLFEGIAEAMDSGELPITFR